MPLPDPPIPLRPELRPGPKECEIHVEQDSPQHTVEDRSNAEQQRNLPPPEVGFADREAKCD